MKVMSTCTELNKKYMHSTMILVIHYLLHTLLLGVCPIQRGRVGEGVERRLGNWGSSFSTNDL